MDTEGIKALLAAAYTVRWILVFCGIAGVGCLLARGGSEAGRG